MTSLHADDAFLNYYQFSHDPFTPRVPGFKFFAAQRKSVLGQLHHLARYDHSLLLVTGPKGSGKTLLRQALVASTNKQAVHSLVFSGRECATADSVLALIARGIDATSPSSSSILKRTGQLALTGQEEYLLVDDASLLDESALQVLLTLAAGNGEGRLHVFLFAEADLADRLGQLAESEESFRAIELQPYADIETREYLALRLEGAGQSLDLLTLEQIEDIHEQSGGWPGAINLIARDTLIDAMLADRDEKATSGFSLRLPRKHLLAVVIVCAVVVAFWFMNSGKPEIPVKRPLAEEAGAPGEPKAPDSAVEFSGSNVPLPQVAQPVIREPLAQASADPEVEESTDQSLVQADEGENTAETKLETVSSVPLPLPASPEVKSEPAQGIQPLSAASDSKPVTVVEPIVGLPAAKPASAAKPEAVALPKPNPKPVAAATKPGPASQLVGTPASVKWYEAQSPARYALQILGTRSETSAKTFVKQNGTEYRYYMKMHQGAPLYVVTYGVFSSRSAADAALKKLPENIQAGKPWPKTFESIQKEMFKGR